MRWSFLSAPATALSTLATRLLSRRRRLGRRARGNVWGPFHLVAFLAAAAAAHATSVTPPSFPELVEEAQVIARGQVTSVTSRWVESPQRRVIKTFVTFAVEKRLKGEPADTMTLEFLGGTVGEESMRVSGMPEFKLGETEILFVTGNGIQFCPLVRFGHGRYHIREDAATHRHYVARNDDTPVASVADVQLPSDDHGIIRAFRSPDAALTPEAFEAQIADEVARHTR